MYIRTLCTCVCIYYDSMSIDISSWFRNHHLGEQELSLQLTWKESRGEEGSWEGRRGRGICGRGEGAGGFVEGEKGRGDSWEGRRGGGFMGREKGWGIHGKGEGVGDSWKKRRGVSFKYICIQES